jgi:hypothetical protein
MGGCGDKRIFILKGIPASATPVESVNSHKTTKQEDVERHLFCFYAYDASLLAGIGVKTKMMLRSSS